MKPSFSEFLSKNYRSVLNLSLRRSRNPEIYSLINNRFQVICVCVKKGISQSLQKHPVATIFDQFNQKVVSVSFEKVKKKHFFILYDFISLPKDC
mmetsp:Transcript_25414/g.25773  ORF Transcript_25414/g.25773 Transcript_25414/m.25773 type:complete len:95 (+) Transcript_25414:208-492(+)